MPRQDTEHEVITGFLKETLSERLLLSRNHVQGLIRIPQNYFDYCLSIGLLYTHFHLNNDYYRTGGIYLLVPIFSRKEQEPLVVEASGMRVECVEFESNLKIEELVCFDHAPSHLRSQEKVRKWISQRYLHRSSCSSVDQLLKESGGVSKILLKKIDPQEIHKESQAQ